MDNNMVGAWVMEDILPNEVMVAFRAATENMVGATYTPILYCGHQVVQGLNYMLICKQVLSDKDRTAHLVKMVINAFMDECKIVSTEEII